MPKNQATVPQNDQSKSPGKDEEGAKQQSNISSPESASSTPGQQTAFCDLSARQKNDFLSKDTNICTFIKNAHSTKKSFIDTADQTPSKSEFDSNNNQNDTDKKSSVTKVDEQPNSSKNKQEHQKNENQSVYRSFDLESPAQATNLPTAAEKLLVEDLQQQSASGQTQSNSLPTIQLSSETDLEKQIALQLQEKLNYRKSSDITHKRSRSAKKSAEHVLTKVKLEETSSKVNTKPARTRSFNTSKPGKKANSSTSKKHHEHHNQTSSRSSSIESNLHIHAIANSPAKKSSSASIHKQIEKQFEKHFEKRARKESRHCKHRHDTHHHRKSSARQLVYPSNQIVSPQPGTLSYSKSSEDIRCSCSHSSELTPTFLLYNGCFSSTSALVAADSCSNSITGLHLHPSPINATGTPILPASFLLLPDTTCHNLSLSPSPTYLTSYSNVQSYNTTPVHKRHRHRSSSKSSKNSKKSESVPPSAIEHLNLNPLKNKLTKSNSVRSSRIDSSKQSCSKNHPCKQCKRKTSLNSTIRGQLNYAEFPDLKHSPTAYTPSHLIQQQQFANISNLNSSIAQSIKQQQHLTATTLATSANTSPLILHNPLQLHPTIALHEPLTKTSSLNPAALGHIVSPVHLCQFNNSLLTSNELATSTYNKSTNQLDAPSTLSVPDLSRLVGGNSIQMQSKDGLNEADVSAAFAKVYRDKPAPDYFTNLFSSTESKVESKPKLIDYLLTGDLDKFLTDSDNLEKLDTKNIKSSSTESLNLKTTIDPTEKSIEEVIESKTTNDEHSQPTRAKSFFKGKLFQTRGHESEKVEDKIEDKIEDIENNEINKINKNEETQLEKQAENKLLSEKKKTTSRHPMLQLLRKAQLTTETDLPLAEQNQDEKATAKDDDQYKIDSNQINQIAVDGDNEESSKQKNTRLVNQSSTEQSNLANETVVDCETSQIKESQSDFIQDEKLDVLESNEIKEPKLSTQTSTKGRQNILLRMLASKKETKRLPEVSKSLDQQPANKTNKKQFEHHTVDIPQTQEEIAESTDELHALRGTNLQKNLNTSKGPLSRTASNTLNMLRRNSLSKDENSSAATNASSSTMAKFKKKAASGLAVRFAKLTHYSSVDNDSSTTADSASSTTAKSHVNTISGRLSNFASRSISLDKPSSNAGVSSTGLKSEKRSLANFKQSANSTSIASTNISLNPLNRRPSLTTENGPKTSDLQEERRDLETVCKSFWDSFIDCQCIECSFNNAAKLISALILFLTIALVINTVTISSNSKSYLNRSSVKYRDSLNNSIKFINVGNRGKLLNSTHRKLLKSIINKPDHRFITRPVDLFRLPIDKQKEIQQRSSILNIKTPKIDRSMETDFKRLDRIKKMAEFKKLKFKSNSIRTKFKSESILIKKPPNR